MDPSLLPLLGLCFFFSPHFLSLSLSPPDASLLLYLLLSAITELVHRSLLLPLQSPIFSLFITLGQTPTLVLINSPSHCPFQLISTTTHSIIRMGSPKMVDLERELAYLWFAAVWGLRHYLRRGGGVGHRWWVRVKRVVPRERDGVDVVLVQRDREASLDEAEGFEVILQEVVTGSRSRVGLTLEVGAVLF